MDSHSNNLPDYYNGFRFNNETPLIVSHQSSLNGSASYFEKSSFDQGFMNNPYASNLEKSSLNMNKYGSQGIGSSNDHEPTDPMIKYINQALLEDSTEERSSVLYDPLTLQAAEKPFYDAIGKKYQSSPFKNQMYVDINAERSFGRRTENNMSGNSKNKVPVRQSYRSNDTVRSPVTSSKALVNSRSSSRNDRNMQNNPFQTSSLISCIFSDSDSILLFQKGMEEAMKFLPTNNQLITNSYKYTLPPKPDVVPLSVGFDFELSAKDPLPISSRGRKHTLNCQDNPLEEPRSRKKSAVYETEDELSELFDKVLLYDVKAGSTSSRGHVRSPDGIDETSQKNTWSKKRVDKNDDVDLRALLTSCVRAIPSNDRTTAYKKLEQIKKHASRTGNACQRMANAFGIAIEARLAGNGPEIYAALASKKPSALQKLKAHEAQCTGCPFRTLGIFFANEMILQVAAKASTLHIVDFGISYGFHWPKLIQELSSRQGGPPKLRITGIELPQAGFRPTALVEETGQRLAKYCERFNVPFEYHVIATKSWESITIEDLKLSRNEVLAVTCMFRFRYLLDETVVADSPRDRVLKLIKDMKPDIFVHSIINGGHHVPLFVNRFREAFFFYSALYDCIDANMSRDHPLRLYFEEDVYGSEMVNVISCEGTDRVERPETYKSWQTRHIRAGLKLLPLNPDLVNKLKEKTADGYHKDYEFHEDGNWVLQGWKGRILYGTSCWVVK
ncbi:hypothetical protein LIER_01856 [Lithospermum erythrorhizon]|uniref:Uncharacterized protein n=1 Tax=Lithospermum erythrorhizon TaxID=34254 RepID=A0AAV3NME9_LITER